MDDYEGPVLDNHLHLNPETGQGLEAVDSFARVGGTHLLIVNLPSWYHGVAVEEADDFRVGFDRTVDIVEAASDVLPGRAWAVLGVHPGLVSKLVDDRDYSPGAAEALMCEGLSVAAEYVDAGGALALKSGRPHYPVADAVRETSNSVMRHAFELAADLDCAVQLHTESTEDHTTIAGWAEAAGLDGDSVVKHYAAGRLAGPVPSVMAERERLERAAERDDPFLMETDYLDDPDRPGAVLGPKTVPRRVSWLLEAGHTPAVRRAHVETPRLVYGIDTAGTLDS